MEQVWSAGWKAQIHQINSSTWKNSFCLSWRTETFGAPFNKIIICINCIIFQHSTLRKWVSPPGVAYNPVHKIVPLIFMSSTTNCRYYYDSVLHDCAKSDSAFLLKIKKKKLSIFFVNTFVYLLVWISRMLYLADYFAVISTKIECETEHDKEKPTGQGRIYIHYTSKDWQACKL